MALKLAFQNSAANAKELEIDYLEVESTLGVHV